MNASIVAAIVRHILTGVGGALALKYGIDGASIDAIIGGASALAGVAWSVYDKRST
jgi:hypothetical protein